MPETPETPERWEPFEVQDEPVNGGILFHNNRYHVILRRRLNPHKGGPDIVHLSIRDNDRTATHDWRDYQRIKNEIVGPEIEMVEVYPRESHLVDMSNQFHLWGFLTEKAVFTTMGLGWQDGRRIWDGISQRPAIPGTEAAVQRAIREEAI